MADDIARAEHHSRVPTSELLRAIAAEHDGPYITLADLGQHLKERSFGFLLLITAILGWIPVLPPGVATIFGVAIFLLAIQMVLGRVRPWLPRWLAERGVRRDAFARLVDRILPAFERIERFSRPRLYALTSRTAERMLALYMVLLAALICVPLPMTNAFPALAVAIMAFALIQQDGLLSVIGVAAGIAAVAIMVAFWGGAYLGVTWALG